MKCDELKAYIKPIKKSITGHTIVGQAYYPKSDVDAAIDELKAEINRKQALMRDDIKTIANLKADYKEACDRLQTANLIKDTFEFFRKMFGGRNDGGDGLLRHGVDFRNRGLYYEAYQRVIYPLKKGKTKWHT